MTIYTEKSCTHRPSTAREPSTDSVCGETPERVRALHQEVIELGDELEGVAERVSEGASFKGPGRADERLRWLDAYVHVVLAPAQDDALASCFPSRKQKLMEVRI